MFHKWVIDCFIYRVQRGNKLPIFWIVASIALSVTVLLTPHTCNMLINYLYTIHK